MNFVKSVHLFAAIPVQSVDNLPFSEGSHFCEASLAPLAPEKSLIFKIFLFSLCTSFDRTGVCGLFSCHFVVPVITAFFFKLTGGL